MAPRGRDRNSRSGQPRVDQDSFLDQLLLPAFPGQVSLVGRYANPALGFDEASVRIFLPDFHWMSAVCLKRYTGGYHFNGNLTIPTVGPMFAAVLGVLEKLDQPEIYQLGDRYDLWRELTPDDDSDVLPAYNRIRRDPDVSGLADRLDALNTQYVRGNHDHWLGKLENQVKDAGRCCIESPDGKILLRHGHRYDSIERILPDEVKVGGVWLCPTVKPSKHKVGPFSKENIKGIDDFLALREKAGPDLGLYPTVQPDGAIPITGSSDIGKIENSAETYLDLARFWHGTGGLNDFEHVSYLTFGDQIMRFEQSLRKDHCLHVIGHTHHARLLVDKLPGGRLFVILDVGGWIEDCTIRPEKIQAYRAPSAQIGVQIGNDIRLYQLGGVLQ